MTSALRTLLVAAVLGLIAIGADATSTLAAPRVVVSILPIHSLVAGVMDGVAQPTLLVPSGASPHTYSLRPSDARTLQSANVIFWVGEHLENYLEKPLETLAGKAKVIEVSSIPGLTLLPTRAGGAFGAADHDDHNEKEAHKDDGPKEPHAGIAEKGHAHGETDAHIWLDPGNARRVVAAAVAELSAVDAANAQRYAENGSRMDARLAALDLAIKRQLAPVKDRAYIVFHDAYQYFERHFGTKIAGSITVSPEQAPGAKRIAELHQRIRTASAVCVFREPQFPAPVVDTLLKGTGVKAGVLDPEGADLVPGTDAYFTLMQRIADSLTDCLKPSS